MGKKYCKAFIFLFCFSTATVVSAQQSDAVSDGKSAATEMTVKGKTPQMTTPTINGLRGKYDWYVSDVTIGLTAKDSGTWVITEYSINARAWETYTVPFIVSDEGKTTIYYKSTDKAGNREGDDYGHGKNFIIRIDKTPPTTSISLSGTLGDNGSYRSAVKVNMNATDNSDGSGVAMTEYSFNGSAWIKYTDPFNIRTKGATSIHYRSIDNAGNSETAKIQEIKIDKVR